MCTPPPKKSANTGFQAKIVPAPRQARRAAPAASISGENDKKWARSRPGSPPGHRRPLHRQFRATSPGARTEDDRGNVKHGASTKTGEGGESGLYAAKKQRPRPETRTSFPDGLFSVNTHLQASRPRNIREIYSYSKLLTSKCQRLRRRRETCKIRPTRPC